MNDLTKEEIELILDKAIELKRNPHEYSHALNDKTLLMLFEKPSLRTRVSFEVGMEQLGGHAIFYSIDDSPLGKKESIHDFSKTSSRMVNMIMARVFKHSDLVEIAKYSDVPVINALSDYEHPCQVLADILTMKEAGKLSPRMKLAYFGDGNNNVTHSLMFAAAIMGFEICVACPEGSEYEPWERVVEGCDVLSHGSGGRVNVTHDIGEAIAGADVVVTDSWMSYHIPHEKEAERVQTFMPYQVNEALMARAKPDAIFMNCLPAMRGMEQTAGVIDGPQSVVFDEAENRLHVQKAVMLYLDSLC